MHETQKKMLCISIHEIDSEPFFKFWLEDYYQDPDRAIHTEYKSDIAVVKELVSEGLLEDLGAVIVLGMLTGRSLGDSEGRTWAHYIYFHERNGRPVLRLDEEPYEEKSRRQFMGNISLPSRDVNKVYADKEFNTKLGRQVLCYLDDQFPLSSSRISSAQ